MKCKVLKSFAGYIEGRLIRGSEGEILDLDDAEIRRLGPVVALLDTERAKTEAQARATAVLPQARKRETRGVKTD
jgi:hypothetical protein